MKKLLVILLSVILVLTMAACGSQGEDEDVAVDADGNVMEDVPATPTDLTEEGTEDYVPDPSATADNETFVTDYSQAAARLGLAGVNFLVELAINIVLAPVILRLITIGREMWAGRK